VALDKDPPSSPADPVAEVVAQDRGDHRAGNYEREPEEVLPGEKTGGKQHGLAGHRNAEILEEHANEQGHISVAPERFGNPVRHVWLASLRVQCQAAIDAVSTSAEGVTPAVFRGSFSIPRGVEDKEVSRRT